MWWQRSKHLCQPDPFTCTPRVTRLLLPPCSPFLVEPQRPDFSPNHGGISPSADFTSHGREISRKLATKQSFPFVNGEAQRKKWEQISICTVPAKQSSLQTSPQHAWWMLPSLWDQMQKQNNSSLQAPSDQLRGSDLTELVWFISKIAVHTQWCGHTGYSY